MLAGFSASRCRGIVLGCSAAGPGSAGTGSGPRTISSRTPPSSAIARSAMSGGNGLPCQSGLSSTSENPLPLTVLARITVGFVPLALSAASASAWSISARSCPSMTSTWAPNAAARRA